MGVEVEGLEGQVMRHKGTVPVSSAATSQEDCTGLGVSNTGLNSDLAASNL